MDLIALHVTVSDLIFYALLFLEEYDCETVGDPQTGVGHLGNVVLFVQYALGRFQLDQDVYVKDNRKLPVEFLRQTHEVFAVESFSAAESTSFHSWFKALFDSSSEGIEDSILRLTHPKVLLRISATLFCQAIKAISAQKIDSETLLNGVSYFTEPLLNWTLVGVIKALIREAQLASNATGGANTTSTDPKNGNSNNNNANNANTTDNPTAANNSNGNTSNTKTSADPWIHYPQAKIHEAFAMSRTNKLIELDVDRCLKICNATRFLQLLWEKVTSSIATNNPLTSGLPMSIIVETARRVTTYVLTMPPNSPGVSPLLPVFMHLVVPWIVATIEKVPEHSSMQTQKSTSIELLTSIILSSLTAALHLEWSMSTVLSDNRPVLGAPSSAVAKRLAHDLRRYR
ncbi:hypothetical protein H1R20_g5939, partial [Candolleomyces eurysporus]